MQHIATIKNIGEIQSGVSQSDFHVWKTQDIVLVIPEDDGSFNSLNLHLWTRGVERFKMEDLNVEDQIRVDVRFRILTKQKKNGERFTVCEAFVKSWEAL